MRVGGNGELLKRAIATAFREEGAHVVSIGSEMVETALEFSDRIDVLVLIPSIGLHETVLSDLEPTDWRRSVTEPLERFFL